MKGKKTKIRSKNLVKIAQPKIKAVNSLGNTSNFVKRYIQGYEEVAKLSRLCKKQGLRVVLTQGSFDLIHIGHARYLEHAKSKGDFLIVGTDNDEKIKARKGPERPIVPQEERLEMLTHLRPVDAVFLKDVGDPKWHLIKNVKPDVLIATRETYSPDEIKELKKYCGEVCVLEPMATTSTSAKIRLLQIGVIGKLSKTLTPKIVATIEGVMEEFARGK